jgi:hypothetical protein
MVAIIGMNSDSCPVDRGFTMDGRIRIARQSRCFGWGANVRGRLACYAFECTRAPSEFAKNNAELQIALK